MVGGRADRPGSRAPLPRGGPRRGCRGVRPVRYREQRAYPVRGQCRTDQGAIVRIAPKRQELEGRLVRMPGLWRTTQGLELRWGTTAMRTSNGGFHGDF